MTLRSTQRHDVSLLPVGKKTCRPRRLRWPASAATNVDSRDELIALAVLKVEIDLRLRRAKLITSSRRTSDRDRHHRVPHPRRVN